MGLDYNSPGISFDLKNGRIFVYKTTAEAIGTPEYARFMFSPEDRVFGIQACGIDDEGAHRFRVSGDQYTVKIMALVRFIYETCGWDKKYTYRINGIAMPDHRMIVFDMTTALKVDEFR